MGEGQENLPKIPGYSFHNLSLTNTAHYKTDHFGFKNGYRIQLFKEYGNGGRELDSNSVGFLQLPASFGYHPFHTYGRNKNKVNPPTKPFMVDYDRKVLMFEAYMEQVVHNSSLEHYRIRHFQIFYYLIDDTMKIVEPKLTNSGLTQGLFLSRRKIPKNLSGEFYTWKDLNIGRNFSFYGHVFHFVNCDLFTQNFYASQGLELNPIENLPPDPYAQTFLVRQQPVTRKTSIIDDKLRRYLVCNGSVLKFDCLWDDRESENGDLHDYILYYNLEDDTISAREVRKKNDGLDGFPFVFRRYKAPKNPPHEYPAVLLERSDEDVDEYYHPKDFLVGNTIFILGRRFLITDCDTFTRKYYKLALNIEQKPRLTSPQPTHPPVQTHVPPHISKFGTIEETMQSYRKLEPNRPRQDELKLSINAQKYLRYSAVLHSSHPEDQIRKFIILYSLSDSQIKVHENVIRNSGIWGGKFLNRRLLEKPGSDPNWPSYYTPNDFYIGAMIDVFKHKFRITGADLYVYKYIKSNQDKFSPAVITNIRNYMYQQGYLKDEVENELNSIIEENCSVEKEEHLPNIQDKCLEGIGAIHTKVTSKRDESILADSRNEDYYQNKPPKSRYGIASVSQNCPVNQTLGIAL